MKLNDNIIRLRYKIPLNIFSRLIFFTKRVKIANQTNGMEDHYVPVIQLYHYTKTIYLSSSKSLISQLLRSYNTGSGV